MKTVLVGFVLGASLGTHLPWMVSPYWCAAGVLIIFWWRHIWCQFSLAFLFGIAWIASFNFDYAEQVLPETLVRRDITTINHIISLPQRIDDGWRFLVLAKVPTQDISTSSDNISAVTGWEGIVRISWYQTEQEPRLGDIWQWQSRLKPPVGFANSAGMDYERYLVSQKVAATGYVRDETQLLQRSLNLRQQLRERLINVTSEYAHRDLMLALTLGDRSYINSERWQLLSATGTSHLIAISGLHIGLIFWLIYKLLQISFGRHPWAYQQVTIARPLFMLIALLLAGGYALLAGFAVPAQRAWFALAMWSILVLLKIRFSRTGALLLLMTLVILLSPEAIYAASYWLSFSAVANIALLNWYWRWRGNSGVWQKISELLLLQCGLSLLMVPVTLLHLGFFAPLTPLSNLLVVPLITFVVVPLLLLGCSLLFIVPSLASPIFYLVDQSLALFSNWLMLLTSQGNGVYYLPFLLVSVTFLASGICLLNRRLWPLAAGLLVIPGLAAMDNKAPNDWTVDVIDVGQGLAVLVRQGEQTLLYDTGNRFKSGFVVAQQTVVPLLRHYQIDHLDYLVLSHDDIDHSGGAEVILDAVEVAQVISPDGNLGRHDGLTCRAGDKFVLGRLQGEFLSPPSPLPANNNNQSCVLRLADAHHSLLLAGDIERSGEMSMIRENRIHSTEWLIAPHHGSKSSSSGEWLDALAPRYAIFSRGAYNHYGMPAATVVERYRERQAGLYDTACSGQITLEFSEEDSQVTTERGQNWLGWGGRWYQRLSGCRQPR